MIVKTMNDKEIRLHLLNDVNGIKHSEAYRKFKNNIRRIMTRKAKCFERVYFTPTKYVSKSKNTWYLCTNAQNVKNTKIGIYRQQNTFMFTVFEGTVYAFSDFGKDLDTMFIFPKHFWQRLQERYETEMDVNLDMYKELFTAYPPIYNLNVKHLKNVDVLNKKMEINENSTIVITIENIFFLSDWFFDDKICIVKTVISENEMYSNQKDIVNFFHTLVEYKKQFIERGKLQNMNARDTIVDYSTYDLKSDIKNIRNL